MTFDRRSLLVSGLALASASAFPSCKDDPPKDGPQPGATAEPASAGRGEGDVVHATLCAVCERLIPSDETGPGAKEARVDRFLARALQDPRLAHVVPMLGRGAAFLNRAARAEKDKTFVALADAEKDDLLERLANNKMRPNDFQGPVFVRFVLALALEGFLGDPRHGGNADEVAWRWLGFAHEGRAQGLLRVAK